jgi:hypothetical protein
MRSALLLSGLACALALPAFAADKDKDKDKDEPKKVEVKGKLHTGVVAIGGETTGVVVETEKEGSYELDLGKDKELRDKADKLDGKAVVVAGTLTVRKGVEVKERRIIAVGSLKAADDK